MKRIKLIVGLLAALILLFSCEEQMETRLTDEAVERLMLDKIKSNQAIGHDLFELLGERIDTDSLKRLLAKSKTHLEFIDLLTEQTSNYFKEVVKLKEGNFLIPVVPMPFMGDAEITLKALVCEEAPGAAPFDPVQAYSDLILKRIKEQASGNDHKEWILVESFQLAGSSPRPMPTESISLAYNKINFLASVPHKTILNPELSDEEVLETLGDILSSQEIPPVAIALLLPAVQKFQEESTTPSSASFDNGLLSWIDHTVDPALAGNLDRDIIRRIQATAFLAGLHTLLLPEYENENQDLATLSILHARYRAALICSAREMRNK